MADIILASSSPRRIELLTQAGLSPRVVAPDVDETELPRETPRAMVARLAREKAEAVAARILAGGVPGASPDGALIIAADTTVVAPDGKRVLGKPRDEAEARRMLAQLSGKTHTVLTGYCILKIEPPAGAHRATRKKAQPAKTAGAEEEPSFEAVRPFRSHVLVRVVRTSVRMRKLSREDIARYVRTGEPMDKAGSYGAQSIGMGLIDSVTGSYANVVGLPICQLIQDLESRFGLGWLGNSPSQRPSRKPARGRAARSGKK